MGGMFHSYVWHDSFLWTLNPPRHLDICVTYPYVWHDSCILAPPKTHLTCRNIFMTWLIHTCDMTYSYVWHGSTIWAPPNSRLWMSHMSRIWLIHMSLYKLLLLIWAPPNSHSSWLHSFVWHDSFIRVSTHPKEPLLTPSPHMSLPKLLLLLSLFICVTWLIHTCVVTHPKEPLLTPSSHTSPSKLLSSWPHPYEWVLKWPNSPRST